ncbi:hypothetical protein PR002_g30993 [Phytophthora rubi]|uniref:Secreted protein n=1 Tax=Phytophthora rubi TaxID=129364 RepID=A0A6A3GNN3_9STRA|nr:hypothetical protein PR002_g30993 [Phytophthora rubi]
MMLMMMSRTVLVVHAQCQNLRIVGIRAVTQEVGSGVLEGHLARQHDHVGASPYEAMVLAGCAGGVTQQTTADRSATTR